MILVSPELCRIKYVVRRHAGRRLSHLHLSGSTQSKLRSRMGECRNMLFRNSIIFNDFVASDTGTYDEGSCATEMTPQHQFSMIPDPVRTNLWKPGMRQM